MPVDRDELRKVQYLNVDAMDGRTVNLIPFWDGTKWHQWFPTPTGLVPLAIVEAAGDYVAREPAAKSDMTVPFVELMWQRASWPDVCPLISAVSADFQNLGTSIEKLDHFFLHRDDIGFSVKHFVKTELEYIFVLSRSIFDLLHEAIAMIWGTKVRLLDPKSEAKRKQCKLPDTFRKMVLRKDKIRTRNDLVSEYALPLALATAYETATPFFVEVRSVRDAIIHRGKDVQLLYSTDKGFCVHKDFQGFYKMRTPIPGHAYNENLMSLLPLLAHVVLGTIETCNELVLAFGKQIALPPELAPGYRVFVRGPHNEALGWMRCVREGGSPWWCDRIRGDRSSLLGPQHSSTH